MVEIEKYIHDGLKIVDGLCKEENYSAALKACEELLRVNPYHGGIQSKLKEVQEVIVQENSKKVDADIAATMHLWDEQKFDELMSIYTRLFQYAPNHNRLKGLIEKLEKTMSKEQVKTRDDFSKKAIEAIQGLIDQNNFVDAVQASNELLGYMPLNTKAQDLLLKAKNGLIDQKLTQNRTLIEGSDFDRAMEFYNSLLTINPNHARSNELATRTKMLIAQRNALAGKIDFNESLDRMKKLFETGEYEKVIQACEEILHNDPKNGTAKIYRIKAQSTIKKEIDIVETRQLKALWASMKKEYQTAPSNYSKI